MTYFKDSEFKCNCGECEWSEEYSPPLALRMVLDLIRDHFGNPITVTSAKRCPQWNAQVGGSQNSRHLVSDASDIVVIGVSPEDVAEFLEGLPFAEYLGIGTYADFTHVDVRGYKARWRG